MSRASQDQMNTLHGMLAESLQAEIQGYKDRGEPVPANLYAQAIRFLKDNGIDSPGVAGQKIDRLASSLPDISELDNVVAFSKR